MKILNVSLVRILQFCVFVLFTFMVLVYFGTLLLLPVTVLTHLISLFDAIGFSSVISVLISSAVVIYLIFLVVRIQGLGKALGDVGIGLISLGQQRIKSFESIIIGLSS